MKLYIVFLCICAQYLSVFCYNDISDESVANASSLEVSAAVMPKQSKIPPWKTGNMAGRQELRRAVFHEDAPEDQKYDKKVYPDNVTVAFGGHLLSFDVDEVYSTFDADMWLRYKWSDSRLTWNPEEHGGITVLHVPSNDIWKPDIALYNSANPREIMDCFESDAIAFSNGDVIWVPPCQLSAHCSLNLDVSPWGEQHCNLKFGSWTLSDQELDMTFFDDKHELDTKELADGLAWEIVSQDAVRETKEYPCCPGLKWVDLNYNITLKRVAEGPARHLGHAH
jgi:hypothetical protein